MINLIRSDGFVLVISSARGLMDTHKGLLVDFGPDDKYIVENFTVSDLEIAAASRVSNLITISREWKSFPE